MVKFQTKPLARLKKNEKILTRKTKASGSQEYSPDINLVQLCKKYQFRGVEFGNWVPYTERVDYVNAFAECCKTLSKIMHTDNLTAKEMQPTMALGGLLCKWIGEGLSKNQFSTSLSAADKKAIAVFETKYIKNQK